MEIALCQSLDRSQLPAFSNKWCGSNKACAKGGCLRYQYDKEVLLQLSYTVLHTGNHCFNCLGPPRYSTYADIGSRCRNGLPKSFKTPDMEQDQLPAWAGDGCRPHQELLAGPVRDGGRAFSWRLQASMQGQAWKTTNQKAYNV